jgi:hypothetical protein
MSTFEYVVAAALVMIAFVKLYDWIEYQIDRREAEEDAKRGG